MHCERTSAVAVQVPAIRQDRGAERKSGSAANASEAASDDESPDQRRDPRKTRSREDRFVDFALRQIADLDAPRFVWDAPWPAHAAKSFSNGKTGLQTVFVESSPEISAAKPGAAPALQRP